MLISSYAQCACLLAVVCVGCASAPKPPDESSPTEPLLQSSDTTAIYQTANDRFDAGAYVDALQLYARIVELQPDHVGALVNAGLCRRRLGDIDGAIRWYDKALAIAPDDTTALQNRLLAGLLLGRNAESLQFAERLASLEPDVADHWVQLGDLYLKTEDHAAAASAYQRAIRVGPEDGTTHYKAGLAAAGLDRFNEAVRSFRRALELNADNRAAYASLAHTYLLLGEYDSAWDTVSEGQQRGTMFDPGFLLELQEQSGHVGPK